MTTGKHGAHINNAAILGANYGCAECHAKTVSNDTTIADVTRHVNGFVDFSGAKAGRSYSSATGVCSTVYCHSDGKGNYKDMTVTNWKSTGTPSTARGAMAPMPFLPSQARRASRTMPTAVTGKRRANTHRDMLGGAVELRSTATPHHRRRHREAHGFGACIPTGAIDVTFNPAKAGTGVTWTAGTKTCANIHCHGTALAPPSGGPPPASAATPSPQGNQGRHHRAVRRQLAPYPGRR